MRPSFRLFGGRFGAAAQFKSYRFTQDLFQCVNVTVRRPHFQLGVAGSA
jgi:hypothetical protein